jgi:hypothetical protein
MRIRSAALVLLVTALVAPILAGGAIAQTRDDLLREIERTDQVIERARLAVEQAKDPLSAEYLGQAIKLQDYAKSSFNADRLLDAARLTRQARERAATARRVAEQSGSAEYILFTLERTDALLEHASPIVRSSGVEPANRHLDMAYEQQRRAHESLRGGRPRLALSLSHQARESVRRALQLAEGSTGLSAERVRRQLERTEELIRESAWLESAGPRAAGFYGQAIRTHGQAVERLEAGDVEAATRLGRRSRDLLISALNAADRPLQEEQVRAAVERSREELDGAGQRAEGERQVRAIENATRHQRRAEEHLAAGRLVRALAEIRGVRRILEGAGF